MFPKILNLYFYNLTKAKISDERLLCATISDERLLCATILTSTKTVTILPI